MASPQLPEPPKEAKILGAGCLVAVVILCLIPAAFFLYHLATR